MILEYKGHAWYTGGSPWNGNFPCRHYVLICGKRYATIDHLPANDDNDTAHVSDSYSYGMRTFKIPFPEVMALVMKEIRHE